MTNKQRAYLSKLAVNEKAILELGKANLTPEFTNAVAEALAARELVKISLLKTCVEDPNEVASVIAERTRCQVVRVIGRKIIFYKQAKQPKIELPR
ncbi:MAG: YhbY family RNA-binding protein [Lachnospiraceae bacterium]|nr:YhbY family RNA-binding protein [Lachnospiraceae bacterium]